MENLTFERRNSEAIGDVAENGTELLRLSLTQMGKPEQERVISIRPQDKGLLEETERLLLDAFEKSHLNGNLNLRLAALATLSLRLLEQN
ncbi:MAG: hypothetical protein ICV52_16655 [Microcoleus sp. C1-bin4]|nr:hypothetical protein [Microcoleus sp. C1-bin4]